MEAFNPLDPQLAIDPYPAYANLRAQEPVHMSALGAYVLTKYEDVSQLLTDNRVFQHQYVTQQKLRSGPQVEQEPYFDYFRRMIFVSDDPAHRRLRLLVSKAFTVKRVEALRASAERIAQDLMQEKSAERHMDFVHDFTLPFPLRVIGTVLGIPDADHETIGAHATALNPVLEFLPMSPEVLARANTSVEVLADYFKDLARKRRTEPTDDLFSALVHATEDGDTLSDEELIANAILLYVAGHETTAGGTGLALHSLHKNPDQWQRLKDQPELIPSAIEELLRYDTPGQGTARVATEDTAFLGVDIPAGSIILGYIGAANRDPAAFPNPNQLDLTRDFKQLPRPLTFGGGAHMCIGRLLAMQEFTVALTLLTQSYPDLDIDEETLAFRPTPLMRGLDRLPIRW